MTSTELNDQIAVLVPQLGPEQIAAVSTFLDGIAIGLSHQDEDQDNKKEQK